VANLKVSSDAAYSKFDVELLPIGSSGSTINISLFESKPTEKTLPILSLMLRRSSGHHPLLAGSIRTIAEDPKNRETIAKQQNALQQLILMTQDDNPIVAAQICTTLSTFSNRSACFSPAFL
jgi:hypothetical protein